MSRARPAAPGIRSPAISDSGKAPLVVLHGGPGCTHDYVDSLKDLAATGRAVIHYDQIGNGRSTHLRGQGGGFLDRLAVSRRTRSPPEASSASPGATTSSASPGAACWRRNTPSGSRRGCAGLVIADSPASMKTWVAEANRLRRALPPSMCRTSSACMPGGRGRSTVAGVLQTAAKRLLARSHVCRLVPMPPEVLPAPSTSRSPKTPQFTITMNGPTEFHVIGTMKGWTIESRLHAIISAHATHLRSLMTRRRRFACSPMPITSPMYAGKSSNNPATCRMSRKRRRASRPSPNSSTRANCL